MWALRLYFGISYKIIQTYNCSGNIISAPDISERSYQFIQNDSSKENDRTFSHGWF